MIGVWHENDHGRVILSAAKDLCAQDDTSVKVLYGMTYNGASYALSPGLANGDLFNHIIAFSPGFMAPPRLQGQPLIFVSHGTHDQVLPVRAGRRIVEKLHEADYDVTYQEFNGPHTVPPEIAREGFDWFMKTPATTAH